jgi:murein DD-endopeptidase MepM/ murein hydrolase activator NlpD
MKCVAVFSFLSLSALLLGCAQFQSSIGEYRGPGDMGRSVAATSSRTFSGVAAVNGNFELTWPVEQIRISQPYRPSRNRRHQGIDLTGPRGTKIYAAHAGRVIYTGHGFHGYGNMIMVEHGDHWASLYAHLSRITVRQGDYVQMGDPIGRMGTTGHSTGVHLHFELMHDKLPVDPQNYLPDASRIAHK